MILKAVAVDGEIIALERFSRIIRQMKNVSLTGSFTRPSEALDLIQNHDVDTVFLDIEMPGINGLELAERIFEIKPHIEIVFVTAYDHYALQAFQVHAIGYLLKPMSLDDVENQITAIIKRRQAMPHQSVTNQFTVQCLGNFRSFPQGPHCEPLHWRTAKAEELFALLLHHQGQPVSREKIVDTLWPEMDLTKTSQHLYTTIWYIRNTLDAIGCGDMLIRARGSYYIKLDGLQCDAVEFMKNLDHMQRKDNHPDQLDTFLSLYSGHYLDDKPYEWALARRTWLENEHQQLQLKLAKSYLTAGNTGKALDMYKTIIRFHPLADEAYMACIEVSLQQDDYTTATLYYKKYKTVLKEELGISPPLHIRSKMEQVC